MTETYAVFHHRDIATEQRKEYGDVKLYDKLSRVKSLEAACRVARRDPLATIANLVAPQEISRDTDKQYIVAAEHFGKYNHYDYGGGSDALRTYDVHTVFAANVKTTLEAIAAEQHVEHLYVGVLIDHDRTDTPIVPYHVRIN